jgi:hypothetical protein
LTAAIDQRVPIERWQDSGVDVLQCPVCALKYRFSSELEEHLKLEHPKFEATARSGDEEKLSAARRRLQARREGDAPS